MVRLLFKDVARLWTTSFPEQSPLWKRALDLLLVTLAAPVWLLLGGGLAAWIQIVSPGPIFFRQWRAGLGGEAFVMWKFRTMRVGASEVAHEAHLDKIAGTGAALEKLDHVDDRLIPGAKWVRAMGLDEVAQLVNVVRGEMSLVGPRPCTLPEMKWLGGEGTTRWAVPPGITGWWQVNGKNTVTLRQMVELDEYYVRRMSLWFDLQILLRTVPTMVSQTVAAIGRKQHQAASAAAMGGRA